jgi:hypothetical protein
MKICPLKLSGSKYTSSKFSISFEKFIALYATSAPSTTKSLPEASTSINIYESRLNQLFNL